MLIFALLFYLYCFECRKLIFIAAEPSSPVEPEDNDTDRDDDFDDVDAGLDQALEEDCTLQHYTPQYTSSST